MGSYFHFCLCIQLRQVDDAWASFIGAHARQASADLNVQAVWNPYQEGKVNVRCLDLLPAKVCHAVHCWKCGNVHSCVDMLAVSLCEFIRVY